MLAPLWRFFGPFFFINPEKSSLIFTVFGVAQNRYLNFAPLSGQNSSCRYSPSSCKPCKIREKRHKNSTVKCNNIKRSDKYQHENMMQNARINWPHISILVFSAQVKRARLALEDKRGLSLGELIRPFCIILLCCYLSLLGL